MAALGFNTVRVYTPPPLWFLDLAADRGLRVLVGMAWEGDGKHCGMIEASRS